MRLLLIDVNCRNSSTGKLVYDLYTRTLEAGQEAAVCYGRGPVVEGRNIFRFAPPWEVCMHALLTRVTGLTGCYSPVATHRLLNFIRQYQPDVVHIHELHAYFVNLRPLLTYLRENHIPTVWTFHCEFMYTGKCGVAMDCERWKTGCGSCPYLREYVATRWFDFTHRMWQQKKELLSGWKELTVVTPSRWLADRVAQSFLGNIPVRVIHNSVNRKIFHPVPSEGLREACGLTGDKVVLAVAPDLLYERKGGPAVLELARQMEEIRFVMIGFTPEQIRSMTFPSNVLPVARTRNQQELAEYYSMADLFVICSQMENYPTTCLEAVACGTPVCGYDVGGVKETYPGHPENFVPFGRSDALKAVIRRVLENPPEQVVGETADMTEQYLQLYGCGNGGR